MRIKTDYSCNTKKPTHEVFFDSYKRRNYMEKFLEKLTAALSQKTSLIRTDIRVNTIDERNAFELQKFPLSCMKWL